MRLGLALLIAAPFPPSPILEAVNPPCVADTLIRNRRNSLALHPPYYGDVMRRAVPYRLGSCFALYILTACAAPMTQLGSVSKLDIQTEQYKQQELVIASQFALQQRLDNVAYRLLKAALPLCGRDVAARTGVAMANLSY